MHTTYVYILSAGRQQLAVGYTDDIRRDMFARRLEAPEGFSPKLVYYETLVDPRQAIDRYIALKQLPKSRQRWLIEAFNPIWEDLSQEWLWSRP